MLPEDPSAPAGTVDNCTLANAPVAASRSTQVMLTATGFAPNCLHAPRGNTVTFVNSDSVQHSAVTVTGASNAFDSKLLDGGASYTVTLGVVGASKLACGVHPAARMLILVTEQ